MSAIALDTAPSTRPRFGDWAAGAFLLPITIVSLIGFIAPVAKLLVLSFQKAEATGALTGGFSLETWTSVLTDPFYLHLILNSIGTSLLITFLTLVASYPIALYIHRIRGVQRSILLVLVISPLLLSAVVRTYGWIAILADGGLISRSLAYVLAEPPRLVFSLTGVVIGLTEILMPYMILALLAGFGRASAEVGAVMIVGGNIEGFTRMMTTAITLETSKGDLPLALALGMILMAIVLAVNTLAQAVRDMAARRGAA